jgi:hypothetical protein
MKRSSLELYALSVCFIIVICFVVATGVAIYNIVRVANPAFTLSSYEYKKYQNNDEFWKSYSCGYENKEKDIQRPPEETLTKQRLESYPLAIASERRNASQTLTIASIIVMVNIVVFLVHWRIARRTREQSAIA